MSHQATDDFCCGYGMAVCIKGSRRVGSQHLPNIIGADANWGIVVRNLDFQPNVTDDYSISNQYHGLPLASIPSARSSVIGYNKHSCSRPICISDSLAQAHFETYDVPNSRACSRHRTFTVRDLEQGEWITRHHRRTMRVHKKYNQQ